MKNREYYETLSNHSLAEFVNRVAFKHECKAEFFCKNVCKYADENGFCTKFNQSGEIDCDLSLEDRIENWLEGEHQEEK